VNKFKVDGAAFQQRLQGTYEAARSFHCIITLEQDMSDTRSPAIAPTRDPDALAADLCAALLTPRDGAEMGRLLIDLCTPAEIRTLAERWHVARLLDGTSLSYREIHDSTGVSTTTVVRVARFLREERNGGYRRAIDSMGGGDAG
jgi:TrpR-related protein YerC/YecD